jgi:hypothetical protein
VLEAVLLSWVAVVLGAKGVDVAPAWLQTLLAYVLFCVFASIAILASWFLAYAVAGAVL